MEIYPPAYCLYTFSLPSSCTVVVEQVRVICLLRSLDPASVDIIHSRFALTWTLAGGSVGSTQLSICSGAQACACDSRVLVGYRPRTCLVIKVFVVGHCKSCYRNCMLYSEDGRRNDKGG
jgi:hypothetical protein